ncbi:hypothetical protein NHX12_032651 [Muraenolepis orangiensis]|uniref:Large ribosomal subunit protein mL64 n=1 Tax=Muraenolepis orangiensis TaxID=630683 RepID=A0A9Q0E674_9TELE|nr:hypothetical protein NHX12_032651 [Muraenolepis orangiensis]
MAARVLWVRTALLRGRRPGPPGGVVVPAVSFTPPALGLQLGPYLPDKDSDRTPRWQRTDHFDRKLYGRYGDASGIEPATLWPNRDRIREMIRDEEQWEPPLEARLRNIRIRETEKEERRLSREKLVAANMAKMPKMVADWRQEQRDTKRKMAEEKARRDQLLAEARERFGYAVDPRSTKFQEMVAEVEKEQKKKKKLLKKRQREEQEATPLATPLAAD